jgi:hypothetical protein
MFPECTHCILDYDLGRIVMWPIKPEKDPGDRCKGRDQRPEGMAP